MQNNFIYEVKAISVYEKTENDLKKEHSLHNIRYARNDSYEYFIKFLQSFHKDKYAIDSFSTSFHLTLEEARKFVTENIGDINEAGCYNYAAICKNPCGRMYYNSCQEPEDFEIYKFDEKNNIYSALSQNNDVYQYILEEVWGFIRA